MFTPARVVTAELLDEEGADEREMLRSLRDLRRFNSLAGGTRVYRSLVRRMLAGHGGKPSILDLGTGTSDLLHAVSGESGSSGSVGLDLNLRHLLYGRILTSRTIQRVNGDALHLPFRHGTFDLVTSSHFFHHFSPEENAEILRESLRVSRVGVIVTDTVRHYAPLAFVHLLGILRLVGEITRFDAPASVRQGYTLTEVRSMLRDIPASRWQVLRMFPYRLGLLLWK